MYFLKSNQIIYQLHLTYFFQDICSTYGYMDKVSIFTFYLRSILAIFVSSCTGMYSYVLSVTCTYYLTATLLTASACCYYMFYWTVLWPSSSETSGSYVHITLCGFITAHHNLAHSLYTTFPLSILSSLPLKQTFLPFFCFPHLTILAFSSFNHSYFSLVKLYLPFQY